MLKVTGPQKITGLTLFINWFKKHDVLQYITLQVEGCEFGSYLFCRSWFTFMLSVSISHGRQCCCRNRLRIRCPCWSCSRCQFWEWWMMPPRAYCWHFLTLPIELQLVTLENTTGKPDLTLYITVAITIGFHLFWIKTWTKVQSYGKLSYVHPSRFWNVC